MEYAMPSQPTITSVAEAMLATLDVDQAVTILLTQFAWDGVFVALSQADDPNACRAMWLALEQCPVG